MATKIRGLQLKDIFFGDGIKRNVSDGNIAEIAIKTNDGLKFDLSELTISYDNSTIGIISNALAVLDEGITEVKLDIASAPVDGKVLYWNTSAGKLDYKDIDEDYVSDSNIHYENKSDECDGSKVLFIVNEMPIFASVRVYLNGLLQEEGIGKDYELNDRIIEFAIAPEENDILSIHYWSRDIDEFSLEVTTLSDNKTFTLPLITGSVYDLTVYWGDGSKDNITTWNQAEATHVYADFSTVYNVIITGSCPKFQFNDAGSKLLVTKLLDVANLDFTHLDFYGCTNLTTISSKLSLLDLDTCENMFRASGVTSIPAGIFDGCTRVAASAFRGTFRGCSGLEGAIPTDLFRYNTAVSSNGFYGTFRGCSGLEGAIPTDLFRYNTAVSSNGFRETFFGCSGLTSIPTDLFRYNTAVSSSGFHQTFYGCSNLTSIPTDLFRYNTAVSSSGFNKTFQYCLGLTSIPADLFRYNTAVSTWGFDATFYGCSKLTSIPTDLFRYNTAVSTSGFRDSFYGCSNLESVSELLFKYNTACNSWSGCFKNCTKLQLNAKIFYDTDEQSTRFLNKTVDFTDCFNRASFTGTQGTAPDLWNCDFGSGTETKTNCFAGAGNSLTSLTNYADIPQSWGGPLAE